MKIRSIALLLAGIAGATPAFAQDEGSNFTGIRFEARAGWDKVGGRFTLPDPDDADETVTTRSNDTGIGYGAELGYDYQIGPVVVGAYVGVSTSDSERCAEATEDDLACVNSARNVTAGGRAGIVIGGNVLVYAKGGYSNGVVGFSYDPDVDNANSRLFADGRNRGGYHYGGGVEMAFTPNFYGRMEYVQTRYSAFDWVDATDDDMVFRIGARRSQATAGLGIRF
jgi:outer membrane immunogenic protein